MSTKIYQAYRAPLDRFVDLIDWARDSMMAAAGSRVDELMQAVKPEAIGTPPDHVKRPEAERSWELLKRLKCVMDLVREDAQSPYKSPFNLSCGFNLWVHGEHVYMIPIGERFITEWLDLDPPGWLEDFRYWNNTDPPDDIGWWVWEERGKVWEQICTGQGSASHNARRLYHEVVDGSTHIGLLDLEFSMGRGRWLEDVRAGAAQEVSP